ncbi:MULTISPECIES: IclR family transcriptional regulator [Prauserella salsuginis group]|uniref:IclR family transcriptional regulator n=1 Tax=Prauserella salsuginis TaxID=387889 RepID=A0ABW6GBL8_9PSEU|nr:MULTISPECIES: helix-turn-helix domain-containing protein [Prauserella salsuginis group]MCR3721900.1 transcriptional regulator, IclR family [Prauserella flava]MCR3735905.1 transcriptional regulator, IclR family [Prauserella salsuginis]
MAEPTGVGVLDRVVAILDTVETGPVSASDLARALGLSVPTAHRIVTAMVKHGLLQRDADGRHHIGPRFASSALTTTAMPLLEEIRDRTGETAQLWVRRGDDRLCTASADSREELRATVPVGTLLPISAAGSAARVLTADPPDPDHPGRRWFESVSERTPGLCSVSVGVRYRGGIIAAVCLSAPVFRVGEDGPGAEYGSLVETAADQFEAALRYR